MLLQSARYKRTLVLSSETMMSPSNARIDPAFTAAYLTNICRVKIQWTNNLADHLRFDSKRRVVTVYQQQDLSDKPLEIFGYHNPAFRSGGGNRYTEPALPF